MLPIHVLINEMIIDKSYIPYSSSPVIEYELKLKFKLIFHLIILFEFTRTESLKQQKPV